MNVLIIEDELPAAKRLMSMMATLRPGWTLHGPLESIEESLAWLESNDDPDLIFMDIQLADGISFELFELRSIRVPVIFTTAFDEYAIRAFQVNSIDYLLKPLESGAMERAVEKFENRGKVQPDFRELLASLRPIQYKQRFLLRKGERLVPLSTDEIAYFQASGKVVLLVTHNKESFITDYTLDKLEEELDPEKFFRANRAFILSLNCICEVRATFNGKLKIDITPPPSDSEVSVSRDKAAQFKSWLGA